MVRVCVCVQHNLHYKQFPTPPPKPPYTLATDTDQVVPQQEENGCSSSELVI